MRRGKKYERPWVVILHRSWREGQVPTLYYYSCMAFSGEHAEAQVMRDCPDAMIAWAVQTDDYQAAYAEYLLTIKRLPIQNIY